MENSKIKDIKKRMPNTWKTRCRRLVVSNIFVKIIITNNGWPTAR
jgi:hypothetical protein